MQNEGGAGGVDSEEEAASPEAGVEGEEGCGWPPHSSPAVPSEPNEPNGTAETPAETPTETPAAGDTTMIPVVVPPPPTEVPAAGDAP